MRKVTTFVKMRLDNLSLSLIILYHPYNKNSKKLQEIEKVRDSGRGKLNSHSRTTLFS